MRDLVLKGDHSFLPTGAMCMQGHAVEDDETKGNEMQVITLHAIDPTAMLDRKGRYASRAGVS